MSFTMVDNEDWCAIYDMMAREDGLFSDGLVAKVIEFANRRNYDEAAAEAQLAEIRHGNRMKHTCAFKYCDNRVHLSPQVCESCSCAWDDGRGGILPWSMKNDRKD